MNTNIEFLKNTKVILSNNIGVIAELTPLTVYEFLITYPENKVLYITVDNKSITPEFVDYINDFLFCPRQICDHSNTFTITDIYKISIQCVSLAIFMMSLSEPVLLPYDVHLNSKFSVFESVLTKMVDSIFEDQKESSNFDIDTLLYIAFLYKYGINRFYTKATGSSPNLFYQPRGSNVSNIPSYVKIYSGFSTIRAIIDKSNVLYYRYNYYFRRISDIGLAKILASNLDELWLYSNYISE